MGRDRTWQVGDMCASVSSMRTPVPVVQGGLNGDRWGENGEGKGLEGTAGQDA